MTNKIDLSTLKRGDFVRFRCGGNPVKVSSVDTHGKNQTHPCFVDNIGDTHVNYCIPYWNNGTANTRSDDKSYTPFDIVEVITKPAEKTHVEWLIEHYKERISFGFSQYTGLLDLAQAISADLKKMGEK